MTDDNHPPMVWGPAGHVLDRAATDVLRWVEFAPPPDLGDWIEGIAVLSLPRDVPTRRWRLIADARPRVRLPMSDEDVPVWLPGAVRPRDVSGPAAGGSVMIRFAPWTRRTLRRGGNLAEWWALAAPLWCELRTVTDPYGGACAWLRRVLPPRGPDRRVTRAWRTLADDGALGVESLARALGTTSRTLRRLMREASGCSLRTVRELERFRNALRLLRSDLRLPWVTAAATAGYCDQSHLNRAFARWGGMPPGRFFGEGHHHFNDVFARSVAIPVGDRFIVAVGDPRLRLPVPERMLVRDRRHARA